MRFALYFDMDTRAFRTSASGRIVELGEVVEVLQRLVDLIDEHEDMSVGDIGRLKDSNGHTIGNWKVTSS